MACAVMCEAQVKGHENALDVQMERSERIICQEHCFLLISSYLLNVDDTVNKLWRDGERGSPWRRRCEDVN